MLRIFCKQRLCSTNWIERRLMGQVTPGSDFADFPDCFGALVRQ